MASFAQGTPGRLGHRAFRRRQKTPLHRQWLAAIRLRIESGMAELPDVLEMFATAAGVHPRQEAGEPSPLRLPPVFSLARNPEPALRVIHDLVAFVLGGARLIEIDPGES